MPEQAGLNRFFDSYRAAFENFDAAAIADHFGFPLQVTGDAGEIGVTQVASREQWLPVIEGLVGMYRQLRVATAEALAIRPAELTPKLVQATIAWRLIDADGAAIYDFDATYTLADLGKGPRIVAIAHNETPRLQAALASLG